MSTSVINPTNEGRTSEQFINMISGNVGNPKINPIGGYYPPGGKPSSTRRTTFRWILPYSWGATPTGNYLNYD